MISEMPIYYEVLRESLAGNCDPECCRATDKSAHAFEGGYRPGCRCQCCMNYILLLRTSAQLAMMGIQENVNRHL